MGSSTYFGGTHLSFSKMQPKEGAKLYRYRVMNKELNQEIGIIHWRGGWRQYVFQARPEIDMSRSCQKEIIKFIDKLMKEWKRNN